MAPSAIVEDNGPVQLKAQSREPLKLSGALSSYESFDVTPVIGREFPQARLVDWLNASNSDELLRDLAITSESLLSPRPPGEVLWLALRGALKRGCR
jgi:hypothetical protein